jgi:hypothetical protein
VFNSAGSTDVIVDVSGWYSDGTVSGGAVLVPVEPGRVYDSRDTGDPIGANQAKVFQFAAPSLGGGATALAFNVTVTGAQIGGFLTMGPGDPSQGAVVPLASNMNFAAGQTVANAVVARKDANGKIFAFASATTHVILDQVGRFVLNPTGSAIGRFVALPPARILDTRIGLGRPLGFLPGIGRVPVTVTGVGGVPSAGVSAVLMNVTVTGPLSDGYLVIWPHGLAEPAVSSINFVPGQTVANLVLTPVGSNGQVWLHNQSAGTHAIFDVVGWFQS